MNYIHYEFDLNSNDVVEVRLDKQANVRLLDSSNYYSYQKGQRHSYHGGLALKSPLRLKVPTSGHWHLVIDLGGYAGTVKASVSAIKNG